MAAVKMQTLPFASDLCDDGDGEVAAAVVVVAGMLHIGL